MKHSLSPIVLAIVASTSGIAQAQQALPTPQQTAINELVKPTNGAWIQYINDTAEEINNTAQKDLSDQKTKDYLKQATDGIKANPDRINLLTAQGVLADAKIDKAQTTADQANATAEAAKKAIFAEGVDKTIVDTWADEISTKADSLTDANQRNALKQYATAIKNTGNAIDLATAKAMLAEYQTQDLNKIVTNKADQAELAKKADQATVTALQNTVADNENALKQLGLATIDGFGNVDKAIKASEQNALNANQKSHDFLDAKKADKTELAKKADKDELDNVTKALLESTSLQAQTINSINQTVATNEDALKQLGLATIDGFGNVDKAIKASEQNALNANQKSHDFLDAKKADKTELAKKADKDELDKDTKALLESTSLQAQTINSINQTVATNEDALKQLGLATIDGFGNVDKAIKASEQNALNANQKSHDFLDAKKADKTELAKKADKDELAKEFDSLYAIIDDGKANQLQTDSAQNATIAQNALDILTLQTDKADQAELDDLKATQDLLLDSTDKALHTAVLANGKVDLLGQSVGEISEKINENINKVQNNLASEAKDIRDKKADKKAVKDLTDAVLTVAQTTNERLIDLEAKIPTDANLSVVKADIARIDKGLEKTNQEAKQAFLELGNAGLAVAKVADQNKKDIARIDKGLEKTNQEAKQAFLELGNAGLAVAKVADQNKKDIAIQQLAIAGLQQTDTAQNTALGLLNTDIELMQEDVDYNTTQIGNLKGISLLQSQAITELNQDVVNHATNIEKNKQAITKKADTDYVNTELAKKADITYVDTKVSEVEAKIPTAANLGSINNKIDDINKVLGVSNGASTVISTLEQKIDRTAVDFDQKFNKLDRKLSAGVASSSAIAFMPTPQAGGHYLTGGTAFFNGQSAVAIGLSGTTATGNISYKLGGSWTSEKQGAFGVGAGWRWK